MHPNQSVVQRKALPRNHHLYMCHPPYNSFMSWVRTASLPCAHRRAMEDAFPANRQANSRCLVQHRRAIFRSLGSALRLGFGDQVSCGTWFEISHHGILHDPRRDVKVCPNWLVAVLNQRIIAGRTALIRRRSRSDHRPPRTTYRAPGIRGKYLVALPLRIRGDLHCAFTSPPVVRCTQVTCRELASLRSRNPLVRSLRV